MTFTNIYKIYKCPIVTENVTKSNFTQHVLAYTAIIICANICLVILLHFMHRCNTFNDSILNSEV
jgi:hypothetical protein